MMEDLSELDLKEGLVVVVLVFSSRVEVDSGRL